MLVGFEKSMWTVVAMLAILKTGAACVPLEPSHPIARIQAVVKLVGADILLTSPASENRFRPLLSVRTVLMSPESVERLCYELDNTSIHTDIEPNDLAFVLFTSGSTGEPKGICQCLTTSIRAHGKAMSVDSTSRVLQFAAYVFDLSYCEIFTTLSHGGSYASHLTLTG